MRSFIAITITSILLSIAGTSIAEDIGKDMELSTTNAPVRGGPFINVDAPQTWHARNGLGITAGFGGVTCGRDYCDSVLDVKIGGSITGTIGAYYRLIPNLVFFGDATFGYVNTNVGVIGSTDTSKDNGFLFQFIAGGAFHVPMKGWFDPYIGLGIGPIILNSKAEAAGEEFKTSWRGFDIEMRVGANIFLWGVGPMKNFSFGPYLKFGFPIWAKVCQESFGDKTCNTPSDWASQDADTPWDEKPFMFQVGIEARYGFSLVFGS